MKLLNKSKIVILVLLTIIFSGRIQGQELPYEIIEYVGNGTDELEFFGNDKLVKNMWLPNDNTGGLPIEVIYIQEFNKYYVFSNRNLLVFDGITLDLSEKIEICDRSTVWDYSEVDGIGIDYMGNILHNKKMAYNSYLKCLYCATEDEKLIIINCLNNEIITTIGLDELYSNFYTEVYYNPNVKKLYWLVSGYNTIIKILDGNTNEVLVDKIFLQKTISKISGDLSGTRIFACIHIPGTYVAFLDGTTLNDIVAPIPTSDLILDLVHNNNTDKLYICPHKNSVTSNSYVGVINCNNYSYQTINNISPCYYQKIAINPNNNRIYTAGYAGFGPGYLNIIDGIQDIILNSIPIERPKTIIFSNTYNSIFCGGYNKLWQIAGDSQSISSVCSENLGGDSQSLAINETSGEMASANLNAGHVTFFNYIQSPNPAIEQIEFCQIGGSTFVGCLNKTNNKYYFLQNNSNNTNSFINIYNSSENQLIKSLVCETSDLRQCTYNEGNGKIFITSKGGNKVVVVSGQDDIVTSTIPNIEEPEEIFSINTANKIICGAKNKIYVVNAADNAILAIINTSSEKITQFVRSELLPNIIYAAGYEGYIYKINLESYEIVNTIFNGYFQNDLAYDNFDHVLYALRHTIGVSVIPESTFSIENNISVNYATTQIYNPLTKRLYVWGMFGTITSIKGSTVLSSYNIGGYGCYGSPGIILNTVNNRLYVHSFFDENTTELETYLVAFDCDKEIVESVVYLDQKQNYSEGLGFYAINEAMVFNPENNQIIIGNRGFSNLSVIQCESDRLGLKGGYNWLSFPRMPRYSFTDEPYSTESVLGNISWFPTDLILESQNTGQFKRYYYPENYWWGVLDEVYSTRGYKLNLDPLDLPAPYITLEGARLYPDCPITLAGNGTRNWIGYFIEESQYPWQAFPTDLYNTKLTLIQAQYWTMVKDETKGSWKITGKVTPIKYGDMVIVKTNQAQSIFFQWNDPEESEDDKIIPIPIAYTWTEQADYIPFYIETDSTSDIAEIAVKVDGECMGATVRQPGDTLVEVDGYLGELPVGAVVEFETWNGQKSSPVEKDGYIVRNPFTGKKEKRNIYIGEKQEYYEVSFKTGEVYSIPDDVSHITCMPNPFANETTITMRLNGIQEVWVEIYDISGAKVNTLLEGTLPGGYYEVEWKGDNETGNKVKEGVYFYKINTGNGTVVTDKIVLIN